MDFGNGARERRADVSETQTGLQIELGCGPNKRPGFVGIDNQEFPGVDIALDVNVDKTTPATTARA